MYKYMYIEAVVQRVLSNDNHKKMIDKYALEGWKFVTAIPIYSSGHGVIKTVELVFEKEVD